jgi:hypothetical protein
MVNYSGLSRFELIKIRDYYMTIRHLVLSLLTVSVLSCAHGENVEIDFHYEGNNRADFSKLKGSLQIAEFFDERQVEDPKLIKLRFNKVSKLAQRCLLMLTLIL